MCMDLVEFETFLEYKFVLPAKVDFSSWDHPELTKFTVIEHNYWILKYFPILRVFFFKNADHGWSTFPKLDQIGFIFIDSSSGILSNLTSKILMFQ